MEKNKEQLKEKKYNSCINDYKVGEKTVCSNEMVVELIAYRNHKDIDVRYEDGYVIEHLSYQSFYQRHCPRPDKNQYYGQFGHIKEWLVEKRGH